jgi:hypothetical protein
MTQADRVHGTPPLNTPIDTHRRRFLAVAAGASFASVGTLAVAGVRTEASADEQLLELGRKFEPLVMSCYRARQAWVAGYVDRGLRVKALAAFWEVAPLCRDETEYHFGDEWAFQQYLWPSLTFADPVPWLRRPGTSCLTLRMMPTKRRRYERDHQLSRAAGSPDHGGRDRQAPRQRPWRGSVLR